MPSTRIVPICILLLSLLSLPALPAAAETEVTACGQVHSGNVFLAGDLDCSGTGSPALTMTGLGRLDLAGHTLTGDSGVFLDEPKGTFKFISSTPGGAVQGTGAPGSGIYDVRFAIAVVEDVTVAGFGDDGVHAEYVTLDGATVRDNGGHGARSVEAMNCRSSVVRDNGGDGLYANTSKKPLVRDCAVTGNGGRGVYVVRRSVRIDGSTIAGNTGHGVEISSDGFSASVRDSAITGNGGDGISFSDGLGRTASVVRSNLSGNGGHGLTGFNKVRFKDTAADSNGGSGILQDAVSHRKKLVTRLARSSVSGNARFGVEVGGTAVPHARVAVRDTTLFGNGTAASCGVTETCADLGSDTLPRVSGTSACDRSYQIGSGLPGSSWGLCSFD